MLVCGFSSFTVASSLHNTQQQSHQATKQPSNQATMPQTQLQLRSAASEELINCCILLPGDNDCNQKVPPDEELKHMKGHVIQLQAALDQAACLCRDAQRQATQSTAALCAERRAHAATKQAGVCISLDYGELLASSEQHEGEKAALSAKLRATKQALAAAQAALAQERAARAAAAAAAQQAQQALVQQLQAALSAPVVTVQFTIACSGAANNNIDKNTGNSGVSSSMAAVPSSLPDFTPDGTTTVTPGPRTKSNEMAMMGKHGAADDDSPPTPGTPPCRGNPSGFGSARLLLPPATPTESDVMAAAQACDRQGNKASSDCRRLLHTPSGKGVARLVSRVRAAKCNAVLAGSLLCKSSSNNRLQRIASMFRRSSSGGASDDVGRQQSSSNSSSIPFFSRSSSSGAGHLFSRCSSASRGTVSQASIVAPAGCVPSLRSMWRSQRA